MDMNDRSLRSIIVDLGGVANGYPRQDSFDITVASELMAIFCLATDLKDLENRIANITIGYTREKKPVLAKKPIPTKPKRKKTEKLPKVDLNSVGLKLVETSSKPISEPKKESTRKAPPKKVGPTSVTASPDLSA